LFCPYLALIACLAKKKFKPSWVDWIVGVFIYSYVSSKALVFFIWQFSFMVNRDLRNGIEDGLHGKLSLLCFEDSIIIAAF
jgi:hypothetical protein